jgi:phosphotransferase system  glucose/maltose/N-acetylglucosamine-specific IIC component
MNPIVAILSLVILAMMLLIVWGPSTVREGPTGDA